MISYGIDWHWILGCLEGAQHCIWWDLFTWGDWDISRGVFIVTKGVWEDCLLLTTELHFNPLSEAQCIIWWNLCVWDFNGGFNRDVSICCRQDIILLHGPPSQGSFDMQNLMDCMRKYPMMKSRFLCEEWWYIHIGTYTRGWDPEVASSLFMHFDFLNSLSYGVRYTSLESHFHD